MPTCLLCNTDFPNWLVIDGRRRNVSSRKYCISCTPFGTHNTKQLIRCDGVIQHYQECIHLCRMCGETNPENFYPYRSDVCKLCHISDSKRRGQEGKKFANNLLGNKCKACGFDKYQQSLDVHHLNPDKKDSNFSSMRSWSKERITKELEDCVLLCSNCHRALHNGIDINLCR